MRSSASLSLLRRYCSGSGGGGAQGLGAALQQRAGFAAKAPERTSGTGTATTGSRWEAQQRRAALGGGSGGGGRRSVVAAAAAAARRAKRCSPALPPMTVRRTGLGGFAGSQKSDYDEKWPQGTAGRRRCSLRAACRCGAYRPPLHPAAQDLGRPRPTGSARWGRPTLTKRSGAARVRRSVAGPAACTACARGQAREQDQT